MGASAASEGSTHTTSSQNGQASDLSNQSVSEDRYRGTDNAQLTYVREGHAWSKTVQVTPPQANLPYSCMVGAEGAQAQQPHIGALLPAGTLITCSAEVDRTGSLCLGPARADSRMVGTEGVHATQTHIDLGALLPAGTLMTCSAEVDQTGSLGLRPKTM